MTPPTPHATDETRGSVLLIEDDTSQCRVLERWLEGESYQVEAFEDGEAGLSSLSHHLPEAICLDLHLPGLDGLEVLARIKSHHPRVAVIVLTADPNVDTVVRAMQLGAYDYLLKPVDRTKLLTQIRNAVESAKMSVRLAQLEREISREGYAGIIGDSPPMRAVFRQIDRVAPSDLTVLIHGESGTGKELVAQALHEHSGRSGRRFVALNCAAIPESLQESELFGHEKGAFTGAIQRREGCFEEAHGGTLFLDEIAELSLPLQAKLLRVLQERTFRRVGGNQDIRADFRLIAATHRNLTDEVEAGRFREDLFFRLAVFDLEIPPLRQRRGDIPLLVYKFLDDAVEGGPTVGISPQAMEVLTTHDWPGNVRELENAIRRSTVIAQEESIQSRDLPPRLLEAVGSDFGGPAAPGSRASGSAPASSGGPGSPPVVPLSEVERRAIEAAFRQTGGNLSKMARQLGIGRTTLYRKMKKFRLS